MTAAEDPSGFDTIVGNADYYIDFLDAREEITDELLVKQVIAGLLELEDGLSVLDAGSGTGADAARIARLVAPSGRVVGVDHSAEMVAEARKRVAGSGLPVSYDEGDVQALTYPDATFDRTRAERVLVHVPDPAAGVRELARVTRPGGLVVVSDLDAGTLFVNSSHVELATSLTLGLTADLANGWMGRRLHRMFVEAGLEDVRCVTNVVQNSVAFSRIVLAGRLKLMLASGQTTEREVAAFWAELEQGEREGWLCSGIVIFTVVGRKP